MHLYHWISMLSPGTCIVVWTVAEVTLAVGLEECGVHLAMSTISMSSLSWQATFSMMQRLWYMCSPPLSPQTGSVTSEQFLSQLQVAKPVDGWTTHWPWKWQVTPAQGSANAMNTRRSKRTKLGIKQMMQLLLVFIFLYLNKCNLREQIVLLMIKGN